MSEIIVLRTNYYDTVVDRMVRRLQTEAGRLIVVVTDERNAKVDVPNDLLKIRLDPVELGLLEHPDYGWRCGDYALYAALNAFPQTTKFWMIEPDVRINSANVAAFFDGDGASNDADFVTAWFVQASPGWYWYNTISPFFQRPFNCMLQLCRLSEPAVKHLYKKRVLLGRRFKEHDLKIVDWPNDEAFVGAILANDGFKITTFKEHASRFKTAGCFTFDRPTSNDWLHASPPDDGIYHPVTEGRKFLSRAQAFLERSAKDAKKNLVEPDERMTEQILFEQAILNAEKIV